MSGLMRRVSAAGSKLSPLRLNKAQLNFQIGISSSSRLLTDKPLEKEDFIEFTKSKGYTSNLQFSKGVDYEAPSYQRYIILGSIAVLGLYAYVREPNDLDEIMDRSLFESVPELEESHLISVINHEMKAGRDTSKLQRRVEELQLARLRKERAKTVYKN